MDLELWGHEHIYERMWPLFNYTVRSSIIVSTSHVIFDVNFSSQVMNGSYENPYTNPGAPVHIVTGSAVRAHTDPV